jgi:N-acetylmuramoyl-L-alanine amidase
VERKSTTDFFRIFFLNTAKNTNINKRYYVRRIGGYSEMSLKSFKSNKALLAILLVIFLSSCGFLIESSLNKDNLDDDGSMEVANGTGAGKVPRANDADIQLLARAINGEARGETYKGQVAVGAVILNRVRSPKFPKTIAGVIYQPGAFTAVADGQINVAIDSKSSVVKAARDAMNGWDPTNGCLYYWNPATATSKWIWSRKINVKIGKHYFGN